MRRTITGRMAALVASVGVWLGGSAIQMDVEFGDLRIVGFTYKLGVRFVGGLFGVYMRAQDC